jgi:hypothetical protein
LESSWTVSACASSEASTRSKKSTVGHGRLAGSPWPGEHDVAIAQQRAGNPIHIACAPDHVC